MISPTDKTTRVEVLAPHMVGKTIRMIDNSSVNCLNIEFTDGTELMLEVESSGYGTYTNVGYIRSETAMLTLNDLRKECKEIGVKVSKKTLSWGPHVTFTIDGISVESVLSKEFYEKHKDTFEKLRSIRDKYAALEIDGQKTYGIKN